MIRIKNKMVYTIQKHLQNILIGCVSGLLVGVFFGVFTIWSSNPSFFWALIIPAFVTGVYLLIILYPTYWACKYWDKKDKRIQNDFN